MIHRLSILGVILALVFASSLRAQELEVHESSSFIFVFVTPDKDDPPPNTTYAWTVDPSQNTDLGSRASITLRKPSGAAELTVNVTKSTVGAEDVPIGPIMVVVAANGSVVTGEPNSAKFASAKPSAETLASAALETRIRQGLRALKPKTTNFVSVCRRLASAIDGVLEDPSITDLNALRSALRRAVFKTIAEAVEPSNLDVWATAYSDLVDEVEDSRADPTIEQLKESYRTGKRVLEQAAADDVDKPRPFEEVEARDEIVEKLISDPQYELFTTDPEFPKTVRKLIAALEHLKESTDPKTTTGQDLQAKTRTAVLEVIQEALGRRTRERWLKVYELFQERMESSKKLNASNAEDWLKGVAILINGLQKAIGVDASLVKALKEKQGTVTTPASTAKPAARRAHWSDGWKHKRRHYWFHHRHRYYGQTR